MGHVKEAFRLLSKSIIRVETPDINLEEEPDVPEQTGLCFIYNYVHQFYNYVHQFCLNHDLFSLIFHPVKSTILLFKTKCKIKQVKKVIERRKTKVRNCKMLK